MSIFDYPRVNFRGTVQLNPGTANNDDYAANLALPDGTPLALVDSKLVQARTYGMSDEDFIGWVQKPQTFNVVGQPGKTAQVIPAEWNYYGGMEMNLISAPVVGVTKGPNQVYCQPTAGEPLTALLGAELGFTGGHITDVNSEGSPPATQFFIDKLTLTKGGQTFLSGTASKGACQWLNFYRNVNLTADGGAGGYVYHVVKKGQAGAAFNVPGFDDPKVVGVILRYYLSRPLQGNSQEQIAALYQQRQANPITLEIVGTLAPLYEHETILTTPTGRLLVCDATRIPTPGTNNNGNPDKGGKHNLIALAPAVLRADDNVVSADFVGTFPDNYQAQTSQNPKFDFGEVSLLVSAGTDSAHVGTVGYADTSRGDCQGWVFDFDISSNKDAQRVLQDENATFKLVHTSLGTVLEETDYYFVSNQQAIYAEQFGTGSTFLNQGTSEPASVTVFRRGRELPADVCPPLTVWQYRSIPLEAPGEAVAISTNHKPGQPIVVDTSRPGNFLFTFSVEDEASPAGYPPKSYLTFMNPPYVTNSPSVSLRILPNDEDFSRYYIDPSAAEPVANDLLTFEVLYEKVLRTYYLLYPVMVRFVQLNSEQDVADHAQAILRTTEPSLWMSVHYMPRTRDMSASRTKLLRAWCRKVKP